MNRMKTGLKRISIGAALCAGGSTAIVMSMIRGEFSAIGIATLVGSIVVVIGGAYFLGDSKKEA